MIWSEYLGVFLYCLSQVSAEWNTKDFMKREHSLIKPYYGSGIEIPFWHFTGSTIVTPNYIRLTSDLQSKVGAIWNSVPVNVRNWELQVHFKVHGKGKDLFGDGFAIWYAKDRMKEGPVFGNNDFFHGLAIILDTYSNHNGPHNHQHPYISAMVNNGTLHYDHDRDGTHTQLAGCEAKFRNLDYDTHIAIRYEKDVLTVSTDIENKAAWKECFQVKGVRLPTGYYLGVSATTGDLSDNHDIMSVRLFELDMPDDPQADEDRSNIVPSATFFEPPRDHVEDPKPSSLSGFKVFILMLVGSIAVVACVVLGIMFYQKHHENKRKRFY
ncbi:vesicular integral-membrane protein VIP36 [Tribolium castaneum]|uniref:Vesicular integral-membrane protein VIP36-like Protein n=1 Tax=Tribolium castaneum TaxID=7070 RepID=D6X3B0_TRICA|nr:PREDICTED: vesicular integral-membrane protein VIP36 [Tribolium castaneum]EFA10355.1 Vesicular integral-membrane protein VIP36-like Protein [Tribolium castaneum]|eukprot:XP_973445.1 PREDICTED: vesicular integral-membrane protein VIP36 [Tribolium castaneum]